MKVPKYSCILSLTRSVGSAPFAVHNFECISVRMAKETALNLARGMRGFLSITSVRPRSRFSRDYLLDAGSISLYKWGSK